MDLTAIFYAFLPFIELVVFLCFFRVMLYVVRNKLLASDYCPHCGSFDSCDCKPSDVVEVRDDR